jgi:hypothetical protein
MFILEYFICCSLVSLNDVDFFITAKMVFSPMPRISLYEKRILKYCHVIEREYRRGLGSVIGFIWLLHPYQQIIATVWLTHSKDHCNYSPHTSKMFSVFTSYCLVSTSNGGRSPSSWFPNSPRPQLPASQFSSVSESELLYDWRFTANQFVLAPSPLRPTTRYFFNWTLTIIILM